MSDELVEKIMAFCEERDWKQFHTPKNLAVSISIEAAELLEIFQWASDVELVQVVHDKREHIKHEIADLYIYLTLLSYDLGIDLHEAVRQKFELNAKKYPAEKAKGRSTKYTDLVP